MANNNDLMNNLMGLLGNEDAKNKLMETIASLGQSAPNQGGTGGSNMNFSNNLSPGQNRQQGGGGAAPQLNNMLSQFGGDAGMDSIMRIKNMMDRFNNIQDDRIGLLNAIRPYMRAGRAANIDMAVRFIKLLNFSNSFR